MCVEFGAVRRSAQTSNNFNVKCESASRRFQPGEGPSRGLLHDCTTGRGTDGTLHSTSGDTGEAGTPVLSAPLTD